MATKKGVTSKKKVVKKTKSQIKKENLELAEKSLVKLAKGFTYIETMIEYEGDEKDNTVLKTKKTKKTVPPNYQAVKTLLERYDDKNNIKTDDDEKDIDSLYIVRDNKNIN